MLVYCIYEFIRTYSFISYSCKTIEAKNAKFSEITPINWTTSFMNFQTDVSVASGVLDIQICLKIWVLFPNGRSEKRIFDLYELSYQCKCKRIDAYQLMKVIGVMSGRKWKIACNANHHLTLSHICRQIIDENFTFVIYKFLLV